MFFHQQAERGLVALLRATDDFGFGAVLETHFGFRGPAARLRYR